MRRKRHVPTQGEKVVRQLPMLGNYLKRARIEKAIRTQQEVCKLLGAKGEKISQSLIAQYELGTIHDPAPNILRSLAELYGKDYTELVLELVRDKYKIDEDDWVLIKSVFEFKKARLAAEKLKDIIFRS